MSRARAFLVAAAVAVASCGGHAPAPVAPAKPAPDPASDRVHAAVDPLYAKEILHGGMVVALIDGLPTKATPASTPRVRYLGFGHTSPTVSAPPDESAIFEIGSISKVLTSILLADMVERGEVTLDEPISRLLPLGVKELAKDGVAVTLAHLASHHAGLPSLPDNFAPTDPGDPYAGYDAAALLAYLEHATLQATPGETYAYSNLGAGLLGWALGRQLGVSYDQAVRTRVLAPLHLAETWISVPTPLVPRVVPGTTASGKAAAPWHFDALAAAGAWRATPRDLVHLVTAAAGATAGRDVPLARALRRTTTPIADADGDMKIGLAWHVAPGGVVWHNGMTGGYASFAGFDPATGRGVVILAATASPLITRLGIGAFDALAGKPLELGLGLVDLPAASLDRLAGSYVLEGGIPTTIVRAGGALEIQTGPNRVRLYPRSATEFLLFEQEASVEFVIDAAAGGSRVVGFVLHTAAGDVRATRVDAPAPTSGGTSP